MRVRDGAALRSYIALTGRSERAVARSAGIGHATLNHLLTGRRERCSAETAQAIEDALETAAGIFFAPD